MNSISPAELQRRLLTDPGLPLLDVRTGFEFAQVHLPNARNEPLDVLDPKALFASGHLLETQPVYLLCQSGARATKAAGKFAADGFSNTVVVEGGTQAWIDAGLPVERAAQTAISLERQVRIAAGTLVLTGVLLSWFVHPYFVGLSAFVGAGLVFAGISDWCGMGLLLAKAPWNQRPRASTRSGPV